MTPPIRLYPDRCLRTPCAPVEAFGEDLERLAADLLAAMRAANGVGITGPHIGVLKRVVVIQLAPDQPVLTYVNPCITQASAETARHAEGSVSMPGVSEEIERPAKVTVDYQDVGGTRQQVTADGWLAVCLQHEIDQLNGIFWLDRLSRLKRDRVVKRYEKLKPKTT